MLWVAVLSGTRARCEAIGVTQLELIETITHLASYARWPNHRAEGGVREAMGGAADGSPGPGGRI